MSVCSVASFLYFFVKWCQYTTSCNLIWRCSLSPTDVHTAVLENASTCLLPHSRMEMLSLDLWAIHIAIG